MRSRKISRGAEVCSHPRRDRVNWLFHKLLHQIDVEQRRGKVVVIVDAGLSRVALGEPLHLTFMTNDSKRRPVRLDEVLEVMMMTTTTTMAKSATASTTPQKTTMTATTKAMAIYRSTL